MNPNSNPSAPPGRTLAHKSYGVLLHITSLPGSPYTGDLGSGAHTFIQWLAQAKAHWWQMLPIHPSGEGNSPYSAISSFAGDPMLIDLVALGKHGWVKPRELKVNATEHLGEGPTVTYEKSHNNRQRILELAFSRAKDELEELAPFKEFCQRESYWLDDFCMFSALVKKLGHGHWHTWPKGLRDRDPKELNEIKKSLRLDILFAAFCQYLFQIQWDSLLEKARSHGIGLIGDLPIFISHRSADAWAHPEIFLLNEDKSPQFVAGAPPDMFNKDGQLWGNALYNWERLKEQKYRWWVERFRRLYNLFDTVRLDHFIGFHRYWKIDAKEKTAMNGIWTPGPGADLFHEVEKQCGRRLLIAEDLGAVVPEVRTLRDQFGFYGMKIFQFAFDGSDEAANHMPHLAVPESVIYTGTHDNNTLMGWIGEVQEGGTRKMASRMEKMILNHLTHYVGNQSRTMNEVIIRQLMASPANLVILPLQDIVGNSKAFRMNTPGTAQGNWRYRARSMDLTPARAQWLAKVAELYSRAPKSIEAEPTGKK
jgi:4-alpha-glucanotransferase